MNKILFILIFISTSLYAQTASEFKRVEGAMVSPTTIEESRVNYNLGSECLKNNKLELAEKHLLKALELDPLFVDAMDHLGLVYRRQNRFDEAIQMYLRSISINDKNYAPYVNLAVVYRLQGKYEDARLAYLKVIDIDKENPESYYGIGQLYYTLGRYEESIKYMQIALSKYYQQESIYVYDASYNLAYAFYNIKNYDEALKYFKFAYHYYKDDKKIAKMISEIESIFETEKEPKN